MTTRQLATHILEFLTEENWCQGAWAIDELGNSLLIDKEAVRWCVVGAAYHLGGRDLATQLCKEIELEQGQYLRDVNDYCGLDAVRVLLKQFIDAPRISRTVL